MTDLFFFSSQSTLTNKNKNESTNSTRITEKESICNWEENDLIVSRIDFKKIALCVFFSLNFIRFF